MFVAFLSKATVMTASFEKTNCGAFGAFDAIRIAGALLVDGRIARLARPGTISFVLSCGVRRSKSVFVAQTKLALVTPKMTPSKIPRKSRRRYLRKYGQPN